MKKFMRFKQLPISLTLLSFATSAFSQIDISKPVLGPGNEKPILVSMSGITGEAAQVLQFDLYVQGFAFTNAEAAQFLISGSNNGDLQGKVTDKNNNHTLVSKAYSGAALR